MNKKDDLKRGGSYGGNGSREYWFSWVDEKYDEYLTVFSNDTEMTPKQRKDLPIFVYTYLLLGCYNTAFRESKVPLAKFNNDSWWFFTADDFKKISDYLNIEIIIDNFDKLIGEEPSKPEVTPEVKIVDDTAAKGDIKEGEGDKELSATQEESKEEESKEEESKEEESKEEESKEAESKEAESKEEEKAP